MRYLVLILCFLWPAFFAGAQDVAYNWNAGGGYSGTNFDHEIFPFGLYAHAERRLVGDLHSAWYVSWHTKSEKDDIVKLDQNLIASLTGLMYSFPLTKKPESTILYTSVMFGLEQWRLSGYANSPVLDKKVDIGREAINGWASQITIGIRMPVSESLSVNASSAYRAKWYNIDGMTSSLNDFVWHGGLSFRF